MKLYKDVDMSNEQLSAFGLGMLGLANAPQPGFQRPLPTEPIDGAAPAPEPKPQPGAIVVRSGDGAIASAVASALAQQAKTAPKVEEEIVEEPEKPKESCGTSRPTRSTSSTAS